MKLYQIQPQRTIENIKNTLVLIRLLIAYEISRKINVIVINGLQCLNAQISQNYNLLYVDEDDFDNL